jgi:hypothetical protein
MLASQKRLSVILITTSISMGVQNQPSTMQMINFKIGNGENLLPVNSALSKETHTKQ